MKTKRIDNRTKEQKKTHDYLVTATDSFMSGWGDAAGGTSKVAWACKPKHFNNVYAWVKNRPEMKYVNCNVNGKYYPKCAHLHIYVVNENHPSLLKTVYL